MQYSAVTQYCWCVGHWHCVTVKPDKYVTFSLFFYILFLPTDGIKIPGTENETTCGGFTGLLVVSIYVASGYKRCQFACGVPVSELWSVELSCVYLTTSDHVTMCGSTFWSFSLTVA